MLFRNVASYGVIVALLSGILVCSAPAQAGPVGGGIGGAILGGILGDIVGGRDGAAWGATIGAGVGAVRGSKKKAQRQAAEAERREAEAERRAWERQRRLEEDRMAMQRQQSFQPAAPVQSAGSPMVSEIQRSLIRLGFDTGTIGVMNPTTKAWVKAYQEQHGLLGTGNLSPELLRHMILNGG